MLNEIKEFMETENLAMMSLGEAAKAERYMKWLVEQVDTANCDHTCFTEGCDCHS